MENVRTQKLINSLQEYTIAQPRQAQGKGTHQAASAYNKTKYRDHELLCRNHFASCFEQQIKLHSLPHVVQTVWGDPMF